MDSDHAVLATLTKSICSKPDSLSFKIETIFFVSSNFFFQKLLWIRRRQFDSPAKSLCFKFIKKVELGRVCPEVLFPNGATLSMYQDVSTFVPEFSGQIPQIFISYRIQMLTTDFLTKKKRYKSSVLQRRKFI